MPANGGFEVWDEIFLSEFVAEYFLPIGNNRSQLRLAILGEQRRFGEKPVGSAESLKWEFVACLVQELGNDDGPIFRGIPCKTRNFWKDKRLVHPIGCRGLRLFTCDAEQIVRFVSIGGFTARRFLCPYALGSRGVGGFFGGTCVVELEEAGQEVFAGGGGDGVAGAVVFWEGFEFLEVVGERDGGAVGAGFVPTVGGEDGLVEGDVQGAEAEDAVAGLFGREGSGGGAVLLRHVRSPSAIRHPPLEQGFEALIEFPGMEEVVDVGEAEPEAEHQFAAVFVVGFANGGEVRVGVLPLSGGEGEGVEALRWGVAEVLFQCAAVFSRPDFVDRGLHDGVVVPPVGGEDFEGVCEGCIY